MVEERDVPSDAQEIYWRGLFQLKADACYIRDYRNSLNKWVTSMATVRAVASAGSIGAWAVWKKYAFIWGSLIAASQVTEALKDVFPFYKRRRALSQWSKTLNRLFIDSQKIWEEIADGQYTNVQIRKLCHQLRSRKDRAEAKYIPDSLNRKNDLFKKAQAEAENFFKSRYDIE